ncbi:Uncharacterised protein [Staphylococcus aureus]|nr:Uncharacterised protein [Staphylococcus aureus]
MSDLTSLVPCFFIHTRLLDANISTKSGAKPVIFRSTVPPFSSSHVMRLTTFVASGLKTPTYNLLKPTL